jgi:bifunctional non-homologous end joining protein LigD
MRRIPAGVHVEPGRVRVLTRGGYDWTGRLSTTVDDARRLAVQTAILDGEAFVLDGHGRSDFRHVAGGAW